MLHGPHFCPHVGWNIQYWTKFMRLSDCQNHCVRKTDCHIMETLCLYYLHTQFWAHSSKGYLLHGPHFIPYACRNIRNWKNVMGLSDCLYHCVARADCHIMEAYGFYYWQTQSWAQSSKGYLLQGPQFLSYGCRNIRNWVKFMQRPDCLNHCVEKGWLSLYESLFAFTIWHSILGP